MLKDLGGHFGEIIGDVFKEIWWVILLVIGGVITIFFGNFNLEGIGLSAILSGSGGIGQLIWKFFQATWWLWLFLILWPTAVSTWLYWRNELFKSHIKFKLLELRIPREVQESPKAMEQILTSLHSLRNVPNDIKERWWDGEITRPFSLEMVSFGGEIHFYIRTYLKRKSLVEAALFSYYPDIELEEVDDYIDKFPKSVQEMYKEGYNLWSTEMVLNREAVYPIKTYPSFESNEEGKQFDPISSFIEVLSKIKKEETVGIQFIIAPAANNWRKKWQGVLRKLLEPKTKAVGEEEGSRQMVITRSPGEVDILKAVEENLSKPAFDTMIRFIYFSPKELFYDSYARRGLTGAFNQYAALNLNSLRQNFAVSTRTRIWYWPHIFPKTRNEIRKQRALLSYRIREIPPETFMGRLISSNIFNWNFATRRFQMNTEAIATLFHLPTAVVLTAPHIRRIESRKGGPPAGLAIFGNEEEIEKFK